MTMIPISLSDERLAQLKKIAEQHGVSPEDFLREHVEKYLDEQDAKFRDAAAYVLKKNDELYRRLA